MSELKFDYIIAGAGAAGLTLLQQLLDSPALDGSILLMDRSFRVRNDRTWCYWSEGPPYMEHLCHSWNRLNVRSEGQVFTDRLEKYSYNCLESGPYRRYMLEQASKSDRVTTMKAKITGFSDRILPQYGTVFTEQGSYSGKWVFQSVINPPDRENARVDNSLIQHFGGWEIETTEDRFDPESVTLMDFDVEQRDGLAFFYILPFSAQRALVEYTLFSNRVLEKSCYERSVETYIQDRFQLKRDGYTILRKEFGAIPMEDRRTPGLWNSRTLNCGTVGGLTKASTGYTFLRTLDHSRTIVKALVNGEPPPPFRGSSYRFRVYDMMLLYLLQHEPHRGRELFHRLFEKNSMEMILGFLEETSSFRQELKIFLGMPPLPFFRSIAKMSHRILTGA